MPTYDYECDACGHKFEEFQSMSDKLLKKCPACKKNKLRRLLGTGAAIIFKGSGFYQTDYRSESYKSAAKAEESSKNSASSSSASSKSDTSAKTDTAKPADTPAKSDTKPSSDSKKSPKSSP